MRKLFVRARKACAVCVERIGVGHGELARAHQSVTRTDFIAIFCVDLVETEGKMFVGSTVAAHQSGEGFFCSRTEKELVIEPIFGAQKLCAHAVPAARFLPQLCRSHDRRGALQTPDSLEFFPNNRFNFVSNAQAQGKVRKQAVGDFSDVPCAHEQLVACDGCISRCRPQGWCKKRRHLHETYPSRA